MNAKKVLIVEDDPALLRGLKDNFQAEGYQVRTATDGQRGLAAMLQDPPDVLLLDLMLPKVNGYEICRTARSRHLHTPIIMLTARTQEQDIFRGLEIGADDTLRNLSTFAICWSARGRFANWTPRAAISTTRSKSLNVVRNNDGPGNTNNRR